MKKELRPFHDHVTCDVCGRTILKGERTESYLAPGGERHGVCELCFVRAEHAGWIREAGRDELPLRGPRPQERRPLLSRFRRRVERSAPEPIPEPPPFADDGGSPEDAEPAPDPVRRERDKPQDPRHVRAVPTTAEVKVERALDLFNGSHHHRTVTGLTRSLGQPYATAVPDPDAPSTVTVLVAWELSWYRYRVDLGDAAEPVSLQSKGDELGDIDEPLRDWNVVLDSEGRLVIGVGGE